MNVRYTRRFHAHTLASHYIMTRRLMSACFASCSRISRGLGLAKCSVIAGEPRSYECCVSRKKRFFSQKERIFGYIDPRRPRCRRIERVSGRSRAILFFSMIASKRRRLISHQPCLRTMYPENARSRARREQGEGRGKRIPEAREDSSKGGKSSAIVRRALAPRSSSWRLFRAAYSMRHRCA